MDLKEFRLSNKDSVSTGAKIKEFEMRHNLTLSTDYKGIVLQKYNGGLPVDASVAEIYLYDKSDAFDVASFDSLEQLDPTFYPTCSEDSDEEIMFLKEKYKKFLLIGNSSGAYLMLGLVPENFGQIFLWVNGDEEKSNPQKIADSFEGFIERLEVKTFEL